MKSESLFHNVIRIKWIICVQKRKELSSMLQRPRWSSIRTSGYLSFAAKKMQQNSLQKHFLRGGKKLEPCYPGGGICYPGVAFATPWLRAWFEGDPHIPLYVSSLQRTKRDVRFNRLYPDHCKL